MGRLPTVGGVFWLIYFMVGRCVHYHMDYVFYWSLGDDMGDMIYCTVDGVSACSVGIHFSAIVMGNVFWLIYFTVG